MNRKIAAVIATFIACATASAQDITADEMIMLDRLRAQYEGQGLKVTPEQEARMLQRIRALKSATDNRAPGAPPGLAIQQQILQQALNPGTRAEPTAVANTTPADAISEEELRTRLRALPAGSTLSNIEYLQDGFRYNGKRFADADGRISRFTLDALSGTITYLVGDGPLESVKLATIGSSASSVKIGRVRRIDGTYRFESITGRSISGESLYLLADGVLLMRDTVGFRYTAGQGTTQIDIPKGWYPTPLQRGNLAGTGWLLLEKDTEQEKSNPLNLFSGLSKAVGMTESNEYALLNMQDGRTVLLDISNNGKRVYASSQCRRKNAVVSACEHATGYDSLWEANGLRNLGHYFWRVDWQNTIDGPLAVVLEKGLKQVNAYDLKSGKKVNLFERTLGISEFQTDLTPEGRWKVRASVGFERGLIDDIFSAVQQRPDARAASAPGPQP